MQYVQIGVSAHLLMCKIQHRIRKKITFFACKIYVDKSIQLRNLTVLCVQAPLFLQPGTGDGPLGLVCRRHPAGQPDARYLLPGKDG